MEPDARVETTVGPDRTVVEYTGSDAAAVVVRSVDSERIYLPLVDESESEDDDEERATPYGGESPGESPYSGAGTAGDETSGDTTTPYSGESPGVSPYGGDEGPEPGIHATARGFRVVHPEPATDVRVLR
jgi:hypothetical protein